MSFQIRSSLRDALHYEANFGFRTLGERLRSASRIFVAADRDRTGSDLRCRSRTFSALRCRAPRSGRRGGRKNAILRMRGRSAMPFSDGGYEATRLSDGKGFASASCPPAGSGRSTDSLICSESLRAVCASCCSGAVSRLISAAAADSVGCLCCGRGGIHGRQLASGR